MAVNFTPVGQEAQVNADAVNLDQYDADAAALTDGRFAVVYTRQFNTTDDWDIYLQFVNADGTLSGAHLPIDINGGAQITAAVAPRLGGGAVVVWQDQDGWFGVDSSSGDLSYAIQLRVVSSTGVMSTPLTVADSLAPTSRYSHADVASLADGRIVVVYQHDSSTSADVDIELEVVNSAGTSKVTPFSGYVTEDLVSKEAAVAASGNNALIAYESADSGDIRVKLFNGGTGALNLPTSDDGKLVSSSGDLESADVAALTSGRYIVVWENNTNSDVEGRFVDANGNPIGAAFTIASTGNNENPRVAALPDGGFIVNWENDNNAVLARRFDSAGLAAGDVFKVNTGDPVVGLFLPTVAVNQDTGRAFFAWTDYRSFSGAGQDNNPPGVRGHAFLATIDVINGTPGNNTITTYGLSETINGLDGNDTINAKAGNDIVNGGLGTDLILGGTGADTVAGAEGADTMNGEDGDDLLNGGLGNDSVTGGPGADRFVFNTAVKPKGSNVDTIADFSAADDTILLDNAILTKLKTEGVLAAKYFEVGKKAHDGKDHVVYNNKTGDLLYDKNGDDKGGALLFAHLEGNPDDVSAADFLVI